jgi:integrase
MRRRVKRIPKETVGEWAVKWMCDIVPLRVKTGTRVSYENIVNNHIVPRIGRHRLAALTQRHINAFYQDLLREGRADGKGGLSVKTVRNIHIVLHRALRDAVSAGKLPANPASGAELPSGRGAHAKHAPQVLTLQEQRALIALCGPDASGTAVVTALATGLRMGELLGLRWCDIDLAAGTICVRRQLSRLKDYRPGAPAKTCLALESSVKTAASNRVIHIDQTLAGRLRDYKQLQALPPPVSGSCVPPDMVFTGRKGGFLDPAAFRYRYRGLLNQAGTARRTVHALRHTFATRALEAGVPAKAVSSILGHAGSKITLDTYSHILPEYQAGAIGRVAGYVGAG